MKSVVMVLIVAPLVLAKSHAYSVYAGPFGVTAPAVHWVGSVVPQRHGVSCKLAAHFDVKIVSSTSRQTDRSLMGAASGVKTCEQVGPPSFTVPDKRFALPATISQVPPWRLGSKQPLLTTQLEHSVAGLDVDLSC
jgi:hypothetical protein